MDETLAACLPRLKYFPDTTFVLLPDSSEPTARATAASSGTGVPQVWQAPELPRADALPTDTQRTPPTGSKRPDRPADVGTESPRQERGGKKLHRAATAGHPSSPDAETQEKEQDAANAKGTAVSIQERQTAGLLGKVLTSDVPSNNRG